MQYSFPKPYPKTTQNRYKKRQLNYIGVGIEKEKSLYYYWFQCLRRSKKYRKACANNGKGMKSLYNDFGDVFSIGFWDWWFECDKHGTERGLRLFARWQDDPVRIIDKGHSKEKLIPPNEDNRFIVSISNGASKTEIFKELGRVLSSRNKSIAKQFGDKPPKYSPHSLKVDVPSLTKSLKAYDMKASGRSLVAIGAIAQGMNDVRDKEFIDNYEFDYRKMGRFKDSDGIKQQDIFGKKIKDNYGGMSDIRTRKRPDSLHNFYDRDKKVYLISHAHRLIEKAKANIEGVERGIFPLPHKPKNTK